MTIKAFVFDAYGTLYDVQSVAAVTDAAFPGYGEYITQVWRMKQLEYTWLRSLMGRYEDFWAVTRDALSYTLGTIGLKADQTQLDAITGQYNALAPYPEAMEALDALSAYRVAILSNGSPGMLAALVYNSGLQHHFERVMSVDVKGVYKPDPRAYELVEETLGISPNEVVFVSSNGFDTAGAKSYGFKVARIERVTLPALNEELRESANVGPTSVFKAMRTQVEEIGYRPDFSISSLRDLIPIAQSLDGGGRSSAKRSVPLPV